MNRLAWVGFLVAAALYTARVTYQRRTEERKLLPFRRAFQSFYDYHRKAVPGGD